MCLCIKPHTYWNHTLLSCEHVWMLKKTGRSWHACVTGKLWTGVTKPVAPQWYNSLCQLKQKGLNKMAHTVTIMKWFISNVWPWIRVWILLIRLRYIFMNLMCLIQTVVVEGRASVSLSILSKYQEHHILWSFFICVNIEWKIIN